MASLGILSGSQSGYLIYSSTFSPFPFDKAVSLTTDSPFLLSRFLVSLFDTCFLPLNLLPTSLCGQPGILSGSPPLPFFLFSLSLLLLLPPSSLSLSLRPSLPGPYFLSRCLPKVAQPNVAAPVCSSRPKWPLVAMSGASRLVPPMIRSYPRALFLCAANDAGANYVNGCGWTIYYMCLGTPLTTSCPFGLLIYPALLMKLSSSSDFCAVWILLYSILIPDDVGSAGSACGILSGPSS